jgi:outer membrane lipoprotein-sorting protein
MRNLKFYLLSIVTAFAVFTASAQTADDIIKKTVDALGGKDAISKINSMNIESTMQVMGNEAPNNVIVVDGKGYRSETEFNGQKIITAVSDKGGWTINPMAGSNDATALPADQLKSYKEQLYIGGALINNYAANGYKAELQGQEKVGTANAYKIKLTSKDSSETIYYVDATTYYPVKSVRHGNAMGQDVDITTTMSNYKKTDEGLVVPYSVDIDFGGQFQLSTAVKKIEFNKPVDPKIFDMPGK